MVRSGEKGDDVSIEGMNDWITRIKEGKRKERARSRVGSVIRGGFAFLRDGPRVRVVEPQASSWRAMEPDGPATTA